MKIDISKIKLEDEILKITGENMFNHKIKELFVEFPKNLIAKMWLYGSGDTEVRENIYNYLKGILT